MIRLAALGGVLFALLAPAVAQDRLALVQLEDGRRLEGRVLKMNLKLLEIEVGNKILRVPASLIRSCQFQESGDPATRALRESDEGNRPAAAAPLDENATAVAQDPAPAPAGEIAPAASKEADAAAAANPSRITWTGPLQDPVDPSSPEAVPVDQRRSHLHRRIGMLDRAYPWLVPAAPSQWISLGIMLLVGLGLIAHMSVHVAGGEKIQLGRSMGLGVWYLLTGLAQVAMVPVNDLSIVLMILLNSTLSLFGLVALFGLPRTGAVVALMVQLGVAVLVFGILELVTALLGTVGVST
ncbi:MAG: hypothetical protein ACI9SE_000315 [Neolewinella sp.]|jgi:hypothetical protein